MTSIPIKPTHLTGAFLIEPSVFAEINVILTLIDWRAIECRLANLRTLKYNPCAYSPLMMFKALLLQKWYGLSDYALEQQLTHDLFFRRFVGLSLNQAAPDRNSLWKFRTLISQNIPLGQTKIASHESLKHPPFKYPQTASHASIRPSHAPL